ncbi:MAG: peptidoglycan-associated lipoprotein Pal [Betaproteobacteria bacterium]
MKRVLLGFAMMALLAACASKDPAPTTVAAPSPATNVNTGGTTASPPTNTTPLPGATKIDPLKDPGNVLSKRVVYFDYDTDAVKSEYASLIQAHATYLSQNRNRKVRLEGHADERGSREYNMALGQRRSNAVRKAATALGVGMERVETISFGEDKPKATGHDEASWAQNRRVEIVYDGE